MSVKIEFNGKEVDIDKMSAQDLIEYCNWGPDSERLMLWEFIEQEGLAAKADEFLAEKAREEIKEGL